MNWTYILNKIKYSWSLFVFLLCDVELKHKITFYIAKLHMLYIIAKNCQSMIFAFTWSWKRKRIFFKIISWNVILTLVISNYTISHQYQGLVRIYSFIFYHCKIVIPYPALLMIFFFVWVHSDRFNFPWPAPISIAS